MQAFLLVKNDELAVFMRLLEDVLALFDVAVVVLQAQEGRNQGHVGLAHKLKKKKTFYISVFFVPPPIGS